jgi:hypothetical protein
MTSKKMAVQKQLFAGRMVLALGHTPEGEDYYPQPQDD